VGVASSHDLYALLLHQRECRRKALQIADFSYNKLNFCLQPVKNFDFRRVLKPEESSLFNRQTGNGLNRLTHKLFF
jgi:23S rRNA G2445 N2-methylase RlmL